MARASKDGKQNEATSAIGRTANAVFELGREPLDTNEIIRKRLRESSSAHGYRCCSVDVSGDLP